MKKLLLIIAVALLGVKAHSQGFPNTDSLRTYNIKYITNNPATAFTNLRLHTLLRGIIDHIDTARSGGGSAIGIDTLWALNDSTIRYRKNGAFKNVVLKGVYDTRRKVDTAYTVNDTTLRITINGLIRNIIIPGRGGAVYTNATGGGDTLLTASNTIKRIDRDNYGIVISTNANKLLFSIDTTQTNHLVTTSDLNDAIAASPGGITELTGPITAGPGSGSQVTSITDNSIQKIKLEQSPGLSVIGNIGNTTDDVGNIVAANDGNVLRRFGTSIGFGAINLASSNAVTGVLPVGNIDTSSTNHAVTQSDLNDAIAGTNLQATTDKGATTSNKMAYTTLPYFLIADSAKIPNKKYVDTRQETYLGTIYNANSWANLNDFTQTGSIGAAVSSNKIDISAGAGTFTKTLDLNYYTMLEKWKMTIRFKVTSAPGGATYGIGIGIHSTNGYGQVNALGRIDLTNGGAAGKVILNGHNDNSQMAISSTGLSFSQNDTLELMVERKVDSLIVTAINRSQSGASMRTGMAYELVTGNPQLPNTGRFAVFAFGGTQTIDSMSITSEEIKNSTLLTMGDSKTQGYYAQTFGGRYTTKVNDKIKSTVLHAGGYDRTTEWITYLPEIKALAPKQVLLTNPSNDARSGISSGTSQSQYQQVVDSLTSWGIDVFHALSFYETSQDNSAWNTYILSTYPANRIIDTWNPTKNCTGCVSGDGVHLTAKGNDTLYDAIVNTYKIYGTAQASGAAFTGTTNYYSKFTGASTIGDASMSEDGTRVTLTKMFEQANTNPDYVWYDTDASTNEKLWTTETNGGVMTWRTVNDARNAATAFLQFHRSGNDISSMNALKLFRFEGGIQYYYPPTGSVNDSDIVRSAATGDLGTVAPRATRQALADTAATLRALITPASDLTGGAIKTNIHIVDDADYTVASTDYIILYKTMTAGRTLTMPSAASSTNRMLIIKNGGQGAFSITTSVSYRENSSTTGSTITVGKSIGLCSDGTDWWVVWLQ